MYATIVLGVLFAVVGLASLRPLLGLMGIEGQLLELGAAYGTVLFAALPALILQYAFQSLSTTAGRPDFGFAVTVATGLTNVVLDALFIAVFDWGLVGAAAATAASMAVGGFVPLIYFSRENKSFLRLGRPSNEWAVLGKSAFNGLSEMMTNIAMSVVAISYNLQLLKHLGEDGVAAYGVIVYLSMVFSAIAVGYSMGVAPLMGYQYGARNRTEMQSLFKKSAVITLVSNIAMFVLAVVLAAPLANLFVRYDRGVADLTVHATRIYSLAFLFMGFSVYTSSLFTSLGNGLVSALVSFFRTLLCEVGFVFLLPAMVGADGIWFATPLAEVCSLMFCLAFVTALGRHYGYLPERGGRTGARRNVAGTDGMGTKG